VFFFYICCFHSYLYFIQIIELDYKNAILEVEISQR